MRTYIRKLASFLYRKIVCNAAERFRLWNYKRHISQKIRCITNKDVIKVLFMETELSCWKTELLYKAMDNHSRFFPIVGICTNPKYPYAKKDLEGYLKKNSYKYVDLDLDANGIDLINPDIIFYGSRYSTSYPKELYYDHNLKYVFCGVDYCLSITTHVVHMAHIYYDYCWQFYVEHEEVRKRKKEIMGNKSNNVRVTGVPIQDTLLLPKENFEDPWKDKSGKKRIIYAPHHSFKGSNGDGIEFATFLDYGEDLLKLAQKYHDEITIAFKPHPFLYIKLLDLWGKEKTEAYYNAWKTLSNTQYVDGDYIGLFKYSDAIIHDSASFIVEYLYMDKPSMFLLSESNNIDDMFDYVKECFYSHEHGYNNNDIESFIQNVIKGTDSKYEQRHKCIIHNLMPPNGLSACTNIINAILNG